MSNTKQRQECQKIQTKKIQKIKENKKMLTSIIRGTYLELTVNYPIKIIKIELKVPKTQQKKPTKIKINKP